MKSRIALCCTSLAIFLGSQPLMAQRVSRDATAGAPVSIKGTVRDAATHQALHYVRVILEAERAGTASEVNTDTQGKFEFPNLAHVVYRVRVKLPGYQGADKEATTCDPAACKRIDLSMQNTEYVDFNLVPLASGEPAASAGANAEDAPLPEPARNEFAKGKELADAGKPGESVAHFKKAIELYPAYEQAYFRLGLAYLDQSDLKDGETALTKATELKSNDGAAFLALGELYARQKNFTAAEKPLVRGLELNPDSAQGHCQLSLTYWALKRYADSDAQAQKCESLQPDYALAHLLLGNLALAKRDQPGALREYKEYLRLDPQGQYADAARQQVSKIEQASGSQAQSK
jgi:tetratricopeptide (TPR) repeat protein